MKIAKKILLLTLCAAMLAGVGFMGTMAYLQSQSATSSYSISVGNVSIALVEEKMVGSEVSYVPVDRQNGEEPHLMAPGTCIDRPLKIMVHRNSQACWLFVRIEKTGSVKVVDAEGKETEYTCDSFLAYAMAEGWQALDAEDQILFCRKVEASEQDQIIGILGKEDAEPSRWSNDQVYVLDSVTKQMLEALDNGDVQKPGLIFTAYAIQASGFDTAAEAWDAIMTQTTPAASVPATEPAVTEPNA